MTDFLKSVIAYILSVQSASHCLSFIVRIANYILAFKLPIILKCLNWMLYCFSVQILITLNSLYLCIEVSVILSFIFKFLNYLSL